MKKVKKILLILLTLSLVFAIASCGGGSKGCDTCVDDDGDGICDVCKKEMPEEVADVPLFEEGVPTFQIILAKNTALSVFQAVNNTMKADIQDACEYDIDVFMEEDENDEEIDIEILIGDVTSRGDKYLFDKYTLGKEGYIIKIVGSKIIINGGSDKALIDAIESFTEFLLDKDELTTS